MDGLISEARGKTLLEKGVNCYNGGRYQEALECFKRSLALGERGPELRCFMGHALHSLGKPRQAIDVLSEIIREFPNYLPGYLGLANLLRIHGRLEEAAKTLREASALKLRNAEVERQFAEIFRAKALAYQSAGNLTKAEKAIERLLDLKPNDVAAKLSLSGIMRMRGKIERANVLLDDLVRSDSGNDLLPADRFRALMKLGRYPEAFECAERILDECPSLTDLRAFWNPWEWDPGAPGDARSRELEILRRIGQTERNSPWLHYYIGSLRSGFEAQSDFERLTGFPRKRYGWMLAKAGWSSLRIGQFSKATRQLEAALRQRPTDWTNYGYLAESYLCLGRKKAAYKTLDHALLAAPPEEKGQVLAWRGAFDLWLGNYKNALRLLETACEMGAQHAFCWKGAALLKLGKRDQALECLDNTLRCFPQDIEAAVWRAEANRELGLYEEGLKDLKGKPMGVWTLFNRALCKAALKDFKGMKADFDAIPEFIMSFIEKKVGFNSGRSLSSKEMVKVLLAGLRLARGYRRDDYRQAVWMRCDIS